MSAGELAIFGGTPAFAAPVGAGRPSFPSRERYEAAFAGIFERQYYTNQGPLADALERRLGDLLGVRHAICVTNGTIGLMMAVEALGIAGRVVLPAAAAPAAAHALQWTGLEPVFCDIDPDTLQATAALTADALGRTEGVAAIMGVNLWGGACDLDGITELAEARGLALLFDSAHGFGCAAGGIPLGRFGQAEIFSFGSGRIVTATKGGCVTTDSDELAARLRNIRSSYGAGRPVSVIRTANGRMSEAQAAIALLSLDDYDANRARNEALFRTFEEGTRDIPGFRPVRPAGVSASNHHCIVATVDEAAFGLGAASLVDVLAAENVAARRGLAGGLHRTAPWGAPDRPAAALPGTDAVAASSLRLPVGDAVSAATATRICGIVAAAQRAAPKIRRLRGA